MIQWCAVPELTNRYDNITSANLVLTKVLAFVQLFKPELDLMCEKQIYQSTTFPTSEILSQQQLT